MMLPLPRGTGEGLKSAIRGCLVSGRHIHRIIYGGDTLQLPFKDPNLDKEATTNGPEAQNEGQDIRKEQ